MSEVTAIRTAHIILTRFAVRLSPEGPAPDRAWVHHRCALFERYTLPSLLAQTTRDFVWILFVDSSLDPFSRDHIDEYARADSRIRVRELDPSNPDFRSHVAEVAGSVDRVITTRIDNDDAVARDHLERIRRHALLSPVTERRAFVFTSGYEWSAGELYWRPFPRSPFASLVEPLNDDALTVMAANHERLDEIAPVTRIPGAAWMQVIHDANILNRVRGIRVPRSAARERFAVSDELLYAAESPVSLVLGMPKSVCRLAGSVARDPGNRRKVRELFTLSRRPR